MTGYVRLPNTFSDPAGIVPAYPWPVNHTTEEETDASRAISDGAPTSDIGLLPQQGVQKPLILVWKGTLFTAAEKANMDAWYGLCDSQSIYLTDFSGSHYEILITDWAALRKGVAQNMRGKLPWVWEYTLTMRILRVISGDWAGV